jgi:primary-amine oxidase
MAADTESQAHPNGVRPAIKTNDVNGRAKHTTYPIHPLGPLSAEEITKSSQLITESWPQGTVFHFKSLKLREPAKSELVPYLIAERAGESTPAIDRRSDVLYYLRNTVSDMSLASGHAWFSLLDIFLRRTSFMKPSST